MTTPHIQLGNVATDIGSGANSLVNGLVAQRMREQQLAMQQALSAANVAHLGAQTGLVGQQETALGHGNEPAGDDQLMQVRRFWPQAPSQVLHGMTRDEADKFIDRMSMMSMMGTRFDAGEQDKLRQSYLGASKPARAGIDLYRDTLQQFLQARNTGNPVAAEGMLLSWLKARTNRMNQTEINQIQRLGGVENFATRLASYATGQVPIDPVMLKNFLDMATPGGSTHYNDYEGMRQQYSRMALAHGWNPDDIVVDPDYAQDIPGLEQSALSNARSIPSSQQPTTPPPSNVQGRPLDQYLHPKPVGAP